MKSQLTSSLGTGASESDLSDRSPHPGRSSIARGLDRLPEGRLGDALRPLTPVQRAVLLAEVLGPPLAMRSGEDDLGPRRPRRAGVS